MIKFTHRIFPSLWPRHSSVWTCLHTFPGHIWTSNHSGKISRHFHTSKGFVFLADCVWKVMDTSYARFRGHLHSKHSGGRFSTTFSTSSTEFTAATSTSRDLPSDISEGPQQLIETRPKRRTNTRIMLSISVFISNLHTDWHGCNAISNHRGETPVSEVSIEMEKWHSRISKNVTKQEGKDWLLMKFMRTLQFGETIIVIQIQMITSLKSFYRSLTYWPRSLVGEQKESCWWNIKARSFRSFCNIYF